MNAIKTEGLRKEYGAVTAVDSLDLEVKSGELFSLLGVNGAGKTTAIKLLSCLTKPTAGDAYIFGRSILRERSDVKELIAVSPQESAVAPALTARENLALICGVHGFSRAKRETKLDELSELFGLEALGKKRAGQLSGGWQRRLSIAMALISEPKLLFLDEPTLGLDVIARSELWDIIRRLKGKTTVILTTHYMEEAEELSDRVGIMCGGKLLCSASPDEIKSAAGTDSFEQAFIKTVKEAAK